MGRINTGRWILGGIVAGIIVNISETVLNTMVLKDAWARTMKSLGKTVPMDARATAIWIVWGFAFGLACVWIYAAIRPRFGAGAGTAVKAALAAWFIAPFLSSVAMYNMHLAAGRMLALSDCWVLVETIIATLAGAWLYKESPAA